MTQKKLTKAQRDAQEGEDALRLLREYCPKGTEVLIQFLWVNQQGTNRRHSFFVASIDASGKPEVVCLDVWLANAFGYKISTGTSSPTGIETGHGGGESLVMNLSYELYNDSYALKYWRRQ